MAWLLPFGNTTVALTPWAVLGPLLVMLTVTLTVCPGVAAPCGVNVMATSACGVTGTTVVVLLLAATVSAVLVETEPVKVWPVLALLGTK